MTTLSKVFEWTPTSLHLPSQDAQQEETYLFLPKYCDEKNAQKGDCHDDGSISGNAEKLRLMELDRYLASATPLASSTQQLLFGAAAAKTCHFSHRGLSEGGVAGVQDRFSQKSKPDHKSSSQQCVQGKRSSYHHLVTSSNHGRVVNVLQGEIAHCTPSQADVLVSDDATTCHIVALWSCCTWENNSPTTNVYGGDRSEMKLATMTHIDGPSYEECIKDAVDEHIKYHSVQLNQHSCVDSCCHMNSSVIELFIHIVGGINDGSSIEITDSILQTLATLSNECKTASTSGGPLRTRMVLKTCVAASANDDGTGCPLGRGLAMFTSTGKIFLAEVDETFTHGPSSPLTPLVSSFAGVEMLPSHSDVRLLAGGRITSAKGPGVTLRSVRLWASWFHPCEGGRISRLNVIYRPNSEYLCVEPYFFGPHYAASRLLKYDDEKLLKITSTSPEVEKLNYVSKVRDSLKFMNENKSEKIFIGNQPVNFKRIDENGWVRAER